MSLYQNTDIAEKTVEEAAQAYFEVLSSPPNAWGRHLHSVYGDSRDMLSMMQGAFGRDAFDAAFHDICEDHREARNNVVITQAGPRI